MLHHLLAPWSSLSFGFQTATNNFHKLEDVLSVSSLVPGLRFVVADTNACRRVAMQLEAKSLRDVKLDSSSSSSRWATPDYPKGKKKRI
eukprot:651383-Amphidinium_carterae.1